MEIYVIRHGQTESNRYGKLLGKKDEDINYTGYKQVLNAKQKLKNIKFDVCFTSPYKRTLKTAEILLDKKCKIVVDDRLSERDFGTLEGGSGDEKYTYDFWDYYLNKSDYGVEPLQNLFKRSKNFIDEIKKEYTDKCILIVSHGATIRAIHYNIIGYNRSTNMLSFGADNGEILKYII